jgi:hypothetical protein
MAHVSPLSGEERKSDVGAVKSVEDPTRTSGRIGIRGRLGANSPSPPHRKVLGFGYTRPPPYRVFSARHDVYGFL